jgi:tRNA(adenine34) deaminase
MTLKPPEGLVRSESRMRRALEVARSTPAGDIPVGAVLYDASGKELATGVNRREQLNDPTAHAEVEAIRQAVRVHGDGWRLEGCELVVTLEPCEPKTGACGSLVDVLRAPGALHVPEVRGGVLEEECANLLTDFFGGLR